MKRQEQDVNVVFEKLGGKQFLQEKYPAVYEGLLKGREKQRENGGADDVFVVACPGIFSEKTTARQSAEGNTEKTWALVSDVFGKFPEGMTYVCITGVLKDDYGIVYDTLAVEYRENENPVINTENSLQVDFSDITQMNNVIYSSEGECYASDGTGIVYHYTGGDTQGILVVGGEEIVEEFTITDPVYRDKNNKTDGDIIVLYAREPGASEQSTWDYKFPENQAKNNKVKTMLNFAGTITVKDEYTILGFSETDAPLVLYYDALHEPNAEYTPPTGSVREFFKKDTDQTWVFDYGNRNADWNCDLDLSAYSVSCIQHLYATFSLDVLIPEEGDTSSVTRVTFFVRSTGNKGNQAYFTSDGPRVIIPEISIRWGCFHKNTLIRMADGSEKPICEVVIGDMVQTGDGEPQQVKQVYSGNEKELICLQTEDGMELLVTAGHPVCTAEGVIRAENIHPQSELVALDGSRHAVKFAFICPYDDKVYNLELDDSKALIANGILAGDFLMQNSMPAAKNNRVCTEQGVETARQLRLLMRELGKIKD